MKKSIFIAVGLVILTATSWAQTKFGVHAGINLSNETVKASGVTLSGTTKIGLNVGVSAEFNISDGFAVQPELNFSQMGANVNDLKETLNFISVPVLAKIKLGGFGIYVGPQIGFLLSANTKLYGQTENIISDLKRIDFSAIGGAEYTFAEKFVVSARYQLGLLNTYSDTYSSVAKLVNNGANLSVGYKF
jgi:opacity protein-like surface antigen